MRIFRYIPLKAHNGHYFFVKQLSTERISMRRICLFAGYDKGHKIHDYVVYMIKKLSKISEIYYMADCAIPPDELFKIAPYTQMFYTREHSLKDFGSWHYLINRLGWERIGEYDELILCNDSVYGPLFDLPAIFKQMEVRGYDFWSMTSDYAYNYHLHRYFMVFNQTITRHKTFQNFWKSVPMSYSVKNCELALTPLLLNEGFVCNSYIHNYKQKDILQSPNKILRDVYPPFIKTKSFMAENEYTAGSGLGLRYKIRTKTDYDTALINRHIAQNGAPQTWGQRLVKLSGI